MGDDSKLLTWLRDRLDHIDTQLAQLLTVQTRDGTRLEGLIERVEDLEDAQDEHEKRIQRLALPGQAVKWLLGALVAIGSVVGALYGLGVRLVPSAHADALEP